MLSPDELEVVLAHELAHVRRADFLWNLVQTLLKHDLVDELWLKTIPITLGQGKKLFDDGTITAAFTVTDSLVSSKGVILANYKRAGEVKTGNMGG